MFFQESRVPTVVSLVNAANTDIPTKRGDLYDALELDSMGGLDIGADGATEDDITDNSAPLFPGKKLDERLILLLRNNWYIVNFKGVDLREIRFTDRIDLHGLWFSGAILSYAVFSSANLNGAHLSGAHLSGATLAGADLSGADLQGAHLLGADLRGATLAGADFSGADLQGAKIRQDAISGARWDRATTNGDLARWLSDRAPRPGARG